MKSFFREFDYGSGIITYIEEELTDEKTIEELFEEFLLREDLLQVEYGSRIFLDVGWYGSFAKDGSEWNEFKVRVIQDENWSKPLYTGRAKDLDTLRIRMQTGINKIKRLLDHS